MIFPPSELLIFFYQLTQGLRRLGLQSFAASRLGTRLIDGRYPLVDMRGIPAWIEFGFADRNLQLSW